jgi:membrane protein DedA with SNARE-associated domain
MGSILGDNAGYWIGKRYAFPLLARFGRHIGMSVARIKVGQYLFRVHGGKVVFFGRFIALLRILAAFLAGMNHMPWRTFSSRTPWARSCGPVPSASEGSISASCCFS